MNTLHCFVASLALFGMTAAAASDVWLTREAQLQDLQAVRTQYLPKEMAYTPATRALAELLLDRMEKRAGTMSAVQFEVGLSQLGALADNAHSGLRRVEAKARLPLRMLWFPDGLIIARATGPASDLAGARVIKIEGRSPLSFFEGAKVLLGGSVAGRQHWLNDRIEAAGVLHALGLAKSPDSISMSLRLRDGRTVERTVPMLPVASVAAAPEQARLWSPEPIKGEREWKTALPNERLPLYLQDADRPFRTIPLPGMKALYIQFRSNEDEAGFPIAAFLDSVRKQIASTKPTNLIVDLRFDVGGNILTTLEFTHALPGLVSGRTYLLVGPYTFSAGIISAASIKKHGGERVTVVGDGIGDRLHFWSEGTIVELPNSRYELRYSDGQFNLQDGCTGEPRCVDDLYHVDVNFASLVPELWAPLTSAAYLAARDPAMEVVERDLARR